MFLQVRVRERAWAVFLVVLVAIGLLGFAGGIGYLTWLGQVRAQERQDCEGVLRCVDAGGGRAWCGRMFPLCDGGEDRR